MRRFERMLEDESTIDGLLRFHADHKLALMALRQVYLAPYPEALALRNAL